MKTNDLIWDEAIYPRSAVNQKTVEAYVEALSIGAQFPPVRVQQVVNYSPGKDLSATVMIIIDGVHRWHAFKQAGRTNLGSEPWYLGLYLGRGTLVPWGRAKLKP